jgi:hypothetical protein
MTHTKYSLTATPLSQEVLDNTPHSEYTEEMLKSLPLEELRKVLPSATLWGDGNVSFSNEEESRRYNQSLCELARKRVHTMAAERREQMKKKKK